VHRGGHAYLGRVLQVNAAAVVVVAAAAAAAVAIVGADGGGGGDNGGRGRGRCGHQAVLVTLDGDVILETVRIYGAHPVHLYDAVATDE